MTTSDKLREFAEKWGWFVKAISLDNHRFELNKDPEKCLSDLTALISEHYTANEEVDKMVEEKLKEELIKYTEWLNNTIWGIDELSANSRLWDEYLKSKVR